MFFAKTCGKTVSLSFQCYFRCLARDHWPLPTVFLVPQSFMCNASVTGVNLFIYQIQFYTVNLEGRAVNSFEPCPIHMRPCYAITANIFISGNMYYG
jgi:hypothetical protein